MMESTTDNFWEIVTVIEAEVGNIIVGQGDVVGHTLAGILSSGSIFL